MKKTLYTLLAVSFLSLSLVSCAQQPKSANSSEAIKQASTLESVEAQANYLIKEANAFINSEQFDEAIKTAKHVLSKLDNDSKEAQDIIETAKAKLKEAAEKKVEEMKGKLGNLGQK